MALSVKPDRKKLKTESNLNIEALINKGGSVPENKADPDVKELKNVQIRLYSDQIERIDKVRSKRLVKPSRHTWFLEAIAEKLLKEEE